MKTPFNITYLKNKDIDKQKWDRCIEYSENRIVTALSFYLDNLCPGWDALIYEDYEAVMPIIHGKKYGIHYIYNPYFSARLGIFAKELSQKLVYAFFNSLPSKYKLISIKHNCTRFYKHPSYSSASNVNYLLDLSASYEQLFEKFSKNHKRNIKKSGRKGIYIKQEKNFSVLTEMRKEMMQNVSAQRKIQDVHYHRLSQVFECASGHAKTVSYNVYDKDNERCASAVFLIAFNRAVLYSATSIHGKKYKAGYALVNQFIKDFAGTDIVLDFSGSNIEGIARFNAGFGSTKVQYPSYFRRRFPLSLLSFKTG